MRCLRRPRAITEASGRMAASLSCRDRPVNDSHEAVPGIAVPIKFATAKSKPRQSTSPDWPALAPATTIARLPSFNLSLAQIEPIRFQFISMHRDVRIDGHVFWRARVLPGGSGGRWLSRPARYAGVWRQAGVRRRRRPGNLYVMARSPSNGPGRLTTRPPRGPPRRPQQCRFSFSGWHQAARPCANSVH